MILRVFRGLMFQAATLVKRAVDLSIGSDQSARRSRCHPRAKPAIARKGLNISDRRLPKCTFRSENHAASRILKQKVNDPQDRMA